MQTPDISRTRAIFRTLIYSGPQVDSQPSQTSAIERFTKIMQFLFAHFPNMVNFVISETGRNNVELVFNILAYSDLIRHIQELSSDIQALSEAYVTLVYSEPWYI